MAQKRGVAVGGCRSVGNGAVAVDVSSSMSAFLQNTHDGTVAQQSLQQLRSALLAHAAAISTSTFSIVAASPVAAWGLDDPNRLSQAKQVIQRLGVLLQQPPVAPACVQVLQQLVAISAQQKGTTRIPSSDDAYYYGNHTPTWSELLADESTFMPGIIQILATPGSVESLLEETCWFLGHWARDLPGACSHWRTHDKMVHHLLFLITMDHTTMPRTPIPLSRLRVLQAALWALLQILKGDIAASGWEYCQPELLPPRVLQVLLTLERSHQQPDRDIVVLDIAVQTMWILVQLSQREDAVVNVLLQPTQCPNNNDGTFLTVDLFPVVLAHLFQICKGAAAQVHHQQQQPTLPQQNWFHHPLLEPCLEVIGHWATACNGIHVPQLLSSRTMPITTTSSIAGGGTEDTSLLALMKTLLQWGQQGRLQTSDYTQLLWLSGCLLCDAGTQQHPSTTLAAPSLIPLLSQGLQDNELAVTSQANALECKREGVLALWNAISTPPCDDPEQQEQLQRSSFFQETLTVLLQLILKANANDGTNSPNATISNDGYDTLMALKKLLLSQDVDAMHASMHIINAILRTIPSTRVPFMEVNGNEALEAVCDLPLGNDPASTDAADMAADLIDDFFDSDRQDEEGPDDDQFADPVLQPAQAGGTFVFGLDAAARQNAPIFLPTLQAEDMTMNAPTISAAGSDSSVDLGIGHGRGRGRGRGRGHVLPAWAAQQQPQ